MSQETPLAGKTALVTGSSRGIGKAIALGLARLGADVAVAARTVERKEWIPGTIGETVEEIEALGRKALAVQADLSRREDVENLVERTLEAFGRVDVLVNNAAFLGKAAYHRAWDLSLRSWGLQMEVNVTVPFALTSALAPQMRERGGGMVLNVTSGSADTDSSGLAYGVTKAALNRLTSGMALDYRDDNIVVVALDPGFTRTEIAEVAASGVGMDASDAHPVAVPAKAAAYFGDVPQPHVVQREGCRGRRPRGGAPAGVGVPLPLRGGRCRGPPARCLASSQRSS